MALRWKTLFVTALSIGAISCVGGASSVSQQPTESPAASAAASPSPTASPAPTAASSPTPASTQAPPTLGPGPSPTAAPAQSPPTPTLTPAATPEPQIALGPSEATVAPGEQLQLTAQAPNGEPVEWSLSGEPGAGQISADGLYTAPERFGAYEVIATAGTLESSMIVRVHGPVRSSNGLSLDFSETRFRFNLPVDGPRQGPQLYFKASNEGSETLTVMVSAACNGVADDTRMAGQTPHTEVRPAETVFFGPTLLDGFCGNRYTEGANFNQKLDVTLTARSPGGPVEVTASMSVAVTMGSEFELRGDTPVTIVVSDEQGRPLAADVTIGTDFVFTQMRAEPDTGAVTFYVPGQQGYWVRAESPGHRPGFIELDAGHVSGAHNLVLAPEGEWHVESRLVKTISWPTGFFKVSATKDGSRLLMANGMENWPSPSLEQQSQLLLLDTDTGEIVWSHPFTGQAWSSAISEDGKLAALVNSPVPGSTSDFRGFLRLLDGQTGTVIWTRYLDELFPDCTVRPSYSQGVQFSHDGSKLFVGMDSCQSSFLLEAPGGSVLWKADVSLHPRESIFTADDSYLYVAPTDGWARKLSVADGSEVWRQFVGSFAFTNGLDLSSDENSLCTGTKGGELSVLDTADGTLRFQRLYPTWVVTCRFSPDGSKVVVGGSAGTHLFDLEGNELWHYPFGGADMRFSQDGRWLVVTTQNTPIVMSIDGSELGRLFRIEPGPTGSQGTQAGWLSPGGDRYVYASFEVVLDPGQTTEVIFTYEMDVQAPPG
jgi:outer membrane protein assembly factor BamB